MSAGTCFNLWLTFAFSTGNNFLANVCYISFWQNVLRYMCYALVFLLNKYFYFGFSIYFKNKLMCKICAI